MKAIIIYTTLSRVNFFWNERFVNVQYEFNFEALCISKVCLCFEVMIPMCFGSTIDTSAPKKQKSVSKVDSMKSFRKEQLPIS